MTDRCRECGLFRETRVAMRWGNGTAKRKGHWRRAKICRPCADTVLKQGEPGFFDAHYWGPRTVRKAWGIKEI